MRHRANDELDRIIDLLTEWGNFNRDRKNHGWPKRASFASERVDNCNRSTDTYYEKVPVDLMKLENRIAQFPETFVRMLNLRYVHKKTQSVAARIMLMNPTIFSLRLLFIHEELSHYMFPKNSS